MNYNLHCNGCNKEVKVSTHDAVKAIDENTHKTTYVFECPECKEDIEAERMYR